MLRQVSILKSMHNDHIVRYYDSFIGASAASARPPSASTPNLLVAEAKAPCE
jgi:hypothetical protein